MYFRKKRIDIKGSHNVSTALAVPHTSALLAAVLLTDALIAAVALLTSRGGGRVRSEAGEPSRQSDFVE